MVESGGKPERRVVEQRVVKTDAFMKMPPFSGHRNSEKRAVKAYHLHTFLPEHVRVDLGRLVDEYGGPVMDENGNEQLWRFTGNTRAQVWRCGLSDVVPDEVIADVWDCDSLDAMRELGTHFDSPKAAWNTNDQSYRAFGLAYEEGFRPRALTKVQSAVGGALRRVQAIASGHLRPLKGEQTDYILSQWRDEVRLLDSLLETTISPQVAAKKPLRVPFLAACLLLLRCDDPVLLRSFVFAVLHDEGTKDDQGYDGVQLAVEILDSDYVASDMVAALISCYQLWKSNERRTIVRPKIIDLVTYYKEAMNAKKHRLPPPNEAGVA